MNPIVVYDAIKIVSLEIWSVVRLFVLMIMISVFGIWLLACFKGWGVVMIAAILFGVAVKEKYGQLIRPYTTKTSTYDVE